MPLALRQSKGGLWAWLGSLLGVSAALLLYAPASWLAAGIESASAGKVLLQEPRGTVWTGSAQLVLAGGDGSVGAVRLPSRMNWQISPEWLGASVQLDAPCCTPAAPVAASVWLGTDALAWRLSSARLILPAALLAGLGAPWNTLQLTGELTLTSDQLAGNWRYGGSASNPAASRTSSITGQAQLQADHVSTALSTVRPLGSYRLSTAGSTLRLETKAEAGSEAALILSGTGQIEQGRMSFLGEAMAAKGREEALSNLIHMIGQWQPSSDGRMRSVLKI
jgi:general secretion pathway protein N